MADRSIKVVLRADATQAMAEAKKLAASFTDLSKQSEISVGRAGKAWEIGGQQQAAAAKKAAEEQKRAAAEAAAAQEKAAQKSRDAWQTVGTALTGVGAAWTAVNVAVAKTGIEYNTLQQTSRAALKSILGDAEAVNAQMAELDEFAKTSPFSKATFITAQQQMLAFGIEAEKVVPYLDAINDAVAAAGGNSQTLSEVAFVIAQIGAAGKITAQDLMQLGQRGINAAELIGSQMGKTGAQIRQDITDGVLGADDALNALTDGMKERFDGASANVKETMGGALDRVSAAWRDLSASIMGSAVNPEGGGWLVDLTNELADFLRTIGSLPDGVKQVGGIISGVGGAATLMAGGFLLAAPRIVETVKALETLGILTPGVIRGLGRLSGVAGTAALTFAGLGILSEVIAKWTPAIATADQVADAVQRVADGVGTLDNVFKRDDGSQLTYFVDDMTSAMERFADRGWKYMDQLDVISDLVPFEGWASDLALIEGRFSDIGLAMQAMSREDAAEVFRQLREQADVAGLSIEELLGLLGPTATGISDQLHALNMSGEGLISYSTSAEAVARILSGELPEGLVWTAEGLTTVAAAAEAGIDPLTGLAEAVDEIKYKMVEFSNGTVEMEEGFAAWIEMVSNSNQGFVDLAGSYNSIIEKNKEVAQATADATESSEDSWEDFYDGVTVSMDDWIAKLDEQVAAQQAWQENMSMLAGRVSTDLLDYLAELGPEGAAMVKDMANMTAAELTAMEERFRLSGRIAGNDWASELAAQESVFAAVGAEMGDEAMRGAQEKVRSGESTLAEIIAAYDLVATIDADGNPALEEARRVASQIENMKAVMRVTVVTNGIPTVDSVRGGGYGIDSADGNIIDYYANGGLRENHFAQIAPAGAWRVWAEPETGGESYIPLAPHKRARSLDIWHETGRRLGVQGYADGGFYAPSFTPSGAGSSSTTYGAQTNTYHLSFPGMTEVADVVAVIKDAPRQARLQGGRR